MTISLNCPLCSKQLGVEKQLAAGTVLNCPHCQRKLSYELVPVVSPATSNRRGGGSAAQKRKVMPTLVAHGEQPPLEKPAGFVKTMVKACVNLLLFVALPVGGLLSYLHFSGKVDLADNAVVDQIKDTLNREAETEPETVAQTEGATEPDSPSGDEVIPPIDFQSRTAVAQLPDADFSQGFFPEKSDEHPSDSDPSRLPTEPNSLPGETVADSRTVALAQPPVPTKREPNQWLGVAGKVLATGKFEELRKDGVVISTNTRKVVIPFQDLSAQDQDRISEIVTKRGNEATVPQERPVKKWALLVGVNQYDHFRDLAFCDRDITQLKRRLRNLGFPEEQIIVLSGNEARLDRKPTRENIDLWLQRMLDGTMVEHQSKGISITPRLVGPSDLIVVAFSGHGVQLAGDSYFCPQEAELSKASETLLPMNRVYNRLASVSRGLRLLLVDACRNDPLSGAAPTQGEQPKAFAIQQVNGICSMSSCSAGQISLEDKSLEQGIFSYYLQAALGGANLAPNSRGEIEVKLSQVINFTVDHTTAYSQERRNRKQTPHYIASIEGNPVLGVLKPGSQVTRFEPAKPKGPLAEVYEMKLHTVETPRLPPGWTSNHGGTVSGYNNSGKPVLKNNGDGPAELRSPLLNIHGEFYLEFELWLEDATLDLTLTGADNQPDLPLQFRRRGKWMYYTFGQLEERWIELHSYLEMYVPILVRVERRKDPATRGYEYRIIFNSDPSNSREFAHRFNEYQNFNQIKLGFSSRQVNLGGLKLGPIARKPADPEEQTTTYAFRLTRRTPSPKGWKLRGKTVNGGRHFRTIAPDLKIRGDFYFRFDGMTNDVTRFSVRLLGRNEDRSMPLHFKQSGKWLYVYAPITGVQSYDVNKQEELFRFEMVRKNGAVQISINGKLVEQSFVGGDFGDFDGILLDVWTGGLIISEMELRPYTTPNNKPQ